MIYYLGFMEIQASDLLCFDVVSVAEKEELTFIKKCLDDLAAVKPLAWQELSAKLLRKAWKIAPDQEFQRLCDWGVIDEKVDEEIDEMIRLHSWLATKVKMVSAKVMIGRALEMQRLYKDTHRVFLHAQSSQWLVIADLIKECMKIYFPKKDLHQFKCLRIPQEVAPNKSILAYKTTYTHDSDLKTREDLISADGYFYNASTAESSFYFMWHNYNIMESCSHIALSTIQKFCPSLSFVKQEAFAKKIVEQVEDDRSQLGNLFICCIPKEESEKVQYRSHPYGRVCTCHNSEDSDSILDSLQKGQLDFAALCSNYNTPQFRLFTPELRKENGVKIYLIPSDPMYRKAVKGRIRVVVQEFAEASSAQEKLNRIGFIYRLTVLSLAITACALGMFGLSSRSSRASVMSLG
jgi:hypothetical protein